MPETAGALERIRAKKGETERGGRSKKGQRERGKRVSITGSSKKRKSLPS